MKHTIGSMSVSGVRGKIDGDKYVFHHLTVADINIAGVWYNVRTGEGYHDARRIKACWNACEEAGLNNTVLEIGYITKLQQAAQNLVDSAKRAAAAHPSALLENDAERLQTILNLGN